MRQLFLLPALAAVAAALTLPAMASEITGQVSLSGSIYYTDNGGTLDFFPSNPPAVQSFAALSSSTPSVNSATLTNSFTYNGGISPAIFAASIGGKTGTLALNSITGMTNTADGLEVFLAGTFDQSGYSQELATASFLINSQYMGNNVNLMMFRGIAQLTPPPTPEPASIALLGTGILGMAGFVRYRLKTQRAE